MFVSEFVGGIGNQMFQYAMAKSLAMHTDSELRLGLYYYKPNKLFNTYYAPEGFLLSNVFEVTDRPVTKFNYLAELGFKSVFVPLYRRGRLTSRSKSIIIEKTPFHYDEEITRRTGGYICGFWQTEKYFSSFETEIRKLFRFRPAAISERSKSLAYKIKKGRSVSIHVRGTDYIKTPSIAQKYNNLSNTQYYSSAISMIKTLYEDPDFYVFTDDPDWVSSQEIFQGATVCSDLSDGSWNDLYAMSQCKHHIIANSSFSWWGAWLNPSSEKIVIAPDIWHIDGTKSPDLIPESWIKI